MKSIEQRLKIIEEIISEIHAVLVLGKAPAAPDAEQWRRALDAFLEGDKEPLSLCLKRNGGIVPKAETIYPEAAEQRGGQTSRRMHTRNSKAPSLQGGVCNGHSAGPASLPTAAITPKEMNNRSGTRVFAT
jgi:hypothetical protein